MLDISTEVFKDRILACWMGKNIGGTLGGPLEGVMEEMNVSFYTQTFDGPMPNDDLDLQLLNLHCLEQFGARLSTQNLADAWLRHNFFPFDEYGHALTNHRVGIKMPLAGSFNNLFTDCMGSPIRSEIWAIVAAGNPELAARFAVMDAMVDHAGGEGVYGEIFFAVLEALAFSESDKHILIDTALTYIPEESQTAQAVRATVKMHAEGLDWKENRQRLIDAYGSPNFTDAPLNIAFTILAFLYGKDFEETILIACNCGYDTDCTVATVGSILGIIHGMELIPKRWIEPIGYDIAVSEAVNGAPWPKDLHELTERSYKMFKIIEAEWTYGKLLASDIDFDDKKQAWCTPEGAHINPVLSFELRLSDDHPVILNHEKTLYLSIKNHLTVDFKGELSLELAEGLESSECFEVDLEPNESKEYRFTLKSNRRENVYISQFKLDRIAHGKLWETMRHSFTLLPSRIWNINGEDLEFVTSEIEYEADKTKAKSTLYLDKDQRVDLIVATTVGVKLELDGTVVLSSDEHTDYIPAYHRSDKRKRVTLDLKKGAHELALELSDIEGSERKLAFYIVSNDTENRFMHLIDYRLG